MLSLSSDDDHPFPVSDHVGPAERHSSTLRLAGQEAQHAFDHAQAGSLLITIRAFENVADETALERIGKRVHGLALEPLISFGIHRDQRPIQFIHNLLEVGIIGPQDIGLPLQQAHNAWRDVFHHRQQIPSHLVTPIQSDKIAAVLPV